MDLYLDVARANAEANIPEKPMSRRERISLIVTFAIIFAGIISIAIVLASLPRPQGDSAVDSGSTRRKGSPLFENIRIHSRYEWGSHPPRFSKLLSHPTPLVVISDTVSESCDNFWSCSSTVRNIQEDHMGNSLSDIDYNFLVGGDGSVYEGCGWDTTNVHTGVLRDCTIAIGFIGTFVRDRPSKHQVNGVIELLTYGVQLGKISRDYKILAMNETAPIANPGPLLYSAIKKWAHYWNGTEVDKRHCPDWE